MLDRRRRLAIGAVHEDGADAARAEVVDGELEEGGKNCRVTVTALARPHDIDPYCERLLQLPRQSAPAKYAEGPHHPDSAARMALHDRALEYCAEHHEVALGTRRPVEHAPLVGPANPPKQPAREAVGEAACVGEGLLPDRAPKDCQLGAGFPGGGLRPGLDDRALALNPALVYRRPQRQVDLLEDELLPQVVAVSGEAGLVHLLCEPA